MDFIVDLSDRTAILNTYVDCRKWRDKGKVLRTAAQAGLSDPTEYLPRRPWRSMLELGCGMEQWIQGAIDIADDEATVYACDLSEDVLRLFSDEFYQFTLSRRRSLGCRCVVGEGELLPFEACSFDGITAVFVGHHMRSASGFVGEVARTVKPDGWLLTNSVDWRFPLPDFPSQALQRLLGTQAKFRVLNAFDQLSARRALTSCFHQVRERKETIRSVFTCVEPLIKLHSRLEQFIKQTLRSDQQWLDYLSCLTSIVEAHLETYGSYAIDLPITYFLCEGRSMS